MANGRWTPGEPDLSWIAARHSVLVRELVRSLLRRRRPIAGLRALANRLHVLGGE